MTRLQTAFDSSKHDDMNDYTPFPAGDYLCQISKSEIKANKKKDGKYINLTFKIIEGEHKGRIFWALMNIQNPNQQTVEIANKEFATICRAAGLNKVQDTEELHGIPMTVKVKITPAKDDWPAKNTPIGYSRLKGSAGPVTKNPKQRDPNTPVETEGGGEAWG